METLSSRSAIVEAAVEVTGKDATESRLPRLWCVTPSLYCLVLLESFSGSAKLERKPFLRPVLRGSVFDPFAYPADDAPDLVDDEPFRPLPLAGLLFPPVNPNQLNIDGFSDLAAALALQPFHRGNETHDFVRQSFEILLQYT